MILLLVAILLSIILFPIGFILSLFYPNRKKYLYNIAVGIDQLGNVVCAKLFNLTLIYPSSLYKFGNEDETISSVLGKNKRVNTLTFVGRLLDMLLDAIDRDHSIEAIEEDEK
jgi:8-oxo-dGTP diphosphatase